MRGKVFLLLVAFLLITTMGCNQENLYYERFEIQDKTWLYADSLSFEANMVDTQAIYSLYLEIEHADNFAFQNLYTRIHTTFPNGKKLVQNASLQLADPFTGIWLGQCRSAACKIQVPIQEKAYFNQPGVYYFRIEQYMRLDSLQGIQAIALRITDTGLKRKEGS